ncbi:hypothetical protein GCM10010124_24590 [Pilimelia terevasa]|uniref:Uncharacterized protein n=1 Tax=Pilimelia terevasa TaxID=53372 RepID=A0A8J3FI15_9ACTN|nr:transposase [Pilimelia terevasa]GGK30839.1 hypothetical protein GCM10010124_24590 [Pilimelia terevasa]
MATVRVYCGLAATDGAGGESPADTPLTAAVVDASGRLLDLVEVADDTDGYAGLTALLAVRTAGSAELAVAAQRGEFLLTGLLSAAGQPVAVAGDEATGDHAERFADDDSVAEMGAADGERRAVGLARAVQAGALWVAHLPPPAELAGAAPLLQAQAVLVAARQSASQALRELLRQLFPAALRAFPDPAAPACLAVLDVLPEPSIARAAAVGGRAGQAALARLGAAEGVDPSALEAAVTALRVAVSEAERGDATGAETAALMVRQAVSAVRAYDEARQAAVGTLRAHVAGARFQVRRQALNAPRRAPAAELSGRGGRAGRLTTPPTRGAAPAEFRPAAAAIDVSGPVPTQRGTGSAVPPPPPVPRRVAEEAPAAHLGPAEPEQPFQPRLTRAAIARSRTDRRPLDADDDAAAPAPPALPPGPAPLARPSVAPVPHGRPADPPARERSLVDRANWPLVGSGDPQDDYARPFTAPAPPPPPPPSAPAPPRQPTFTGRVTPPWQADDLPPEPPSLRLVEPAPLDDSALHREGPAATQRIELGAAYLPARAADSAGLRVVTPPPPPIELAAAIGGEGDGDLLIFAATRSAWFTGRDATASDVSWSFMADTGWRAAEEAAEPATGAETSAGLPRRVPAANLVPGSPLQEERPLRIVRDASSIAAHTTGYFQGWRRGQEIGGYAVGGRPGRDNTEGWDFSRAPHGDEGGPDISAYR